MNPMSNTNIQYCHKRNYNAKCYPYDDELNPKGGETIALEVPEPELLVELQPGEFFEKQVGRAKCSLSDNYCKKTGRELAHSRMKPTRLTCTHNISFVEVRFVTLEDPEGNEYTLQLYENHNKARLIDE